MNPEALIRKMWSTNAFMNVLKIQIQEVHCGGCSLVMPIDFDIHTNHWLGVHGGALAALADCVNGITCASVGKMATTLNMNITYLAGVKGFGSLRCTSSIVHRGQSTINIAAQITEEDGSLIAQASTIMFIMGPVAEKLPEKW